MELLRRKQKLLKGYKSIKKSLKAFRKLLKDLKGSRKLLKNMFAIPFVL